MKITAIKHLVHFLNEGMNDFVAKPIEVKDIVLDKNSAKMLLISKYGLFRDRPPLSSATEIVYDISCSYPPTINGYFGIDFTDFEKKIIMPRI